MKLITRLIVLVSTTVLLFAAAVGVYFMILSPIDTIETEHHYFTLAIDAIADLQIQTGRLLTDSFGTQKPIYDKSLAKYYVAIEDIGTKVVLLPKMNQEMADAVETIKKLRGVSQISLQSLADNWKDLELDAKAIFLDIDSTYIMKFFGSMAKRASPEALDLALSHVSTLQDTMQNLNAFLSATEQTIHEKESVVAAEIGRVRVQSLRVSLIVVSFIIIMALLLALVMSRSIIRAIQSLVRDIGIMAKGDLTFRFKVASKDEIGQLSQDLNHVLEMFDASLQQIQGAAKINQVIRQEVIQAVDVATSSAVQISANSNSITSQMQQMDQMIESSNADMNRASTVINGFNARIGTQNEHISESVSAVTQMLASIDSIARITETNRNATEILVEESDRGRAVFEESFARVSEIAESIEGIKEMAAVIVSIASQTNILAMNAAIEAAHAGEFGKGFAVVADEIGKLAAASANSSEEITRTIKDIVERFTEAASTKETTIQAFDAISSRIRDVTAAVEEIYRNAAEMRVGSDQVLEATQNLRTASSDITEESNRISDDINHVQITFGQITRVSREVVSNISEISIGLQQISDGIHIVAQFTEQLSDVGITLDNSVAKFKTCENGVSEVLNGCVDGIESLELVLPGNESN